ncbi:MAG: type 1 glutamine amidotransferase domain-containing protein [Rhodospirillales bacterium]|jgi:protease I|nr:type 1 glutamine amidotransferase domain-containing protein [Rhodospirillales bacterium]
MPDLSGKAVAILATHGFEPSELLEPRQILSKAGAKVDVIGPQKGEIRGWDHTEWGQSVAVDVTLKEARTDAYDALVLPGGEINPDTLRADDEAVSFVKGFVKAGKPVGAICHAPWLLIEAGVMAGRRATSHPSIKTDMKNAGCDWVDEAVVVDGNLVTSRGPDDIPAFMGKLVELISAG